MNRQHQLIDCEGALLGATFDLPDASPRAGLLIVSGGNEPRPGPGGAHARLAARIADAGFAVLRFDRRGVGDSEGDNAGFRGSGAGIATALTALRGEGAAKILAFGNCDAAAALMLGSGRGADALALANPWTLEDHASATAASLRAHYRRRLASPSALRRLLTGGVSLRRLAGGLRGAASPAPAPNPLAAELAEGLADFAGPVRFLLAGRDRTADAFLGCWDRADPRLHTCPDAGHAFIEPASADWLAGQLLDMLRAL